ncbi:MAG TPA: AarF/UbiB family protein [Polyangiaceae bacterium]|nr:AarF/UbiB family protein [Polyangiaceae bacterium]
MLRAFQALRLFWTIIASYGLVWVLSRWSSEAARKRRFDGAHRKNARRLATGFVELRGVFIKTGQVLSVTGTFLPAAYGEELAKLQDKVPPRPFKEVQGRLLEAFGEKALERFGSFDRTPVAAASLAQVHRATTRDGRALAVKVLYPEIERLVRIDLGVLRSLLPVIRLLLPVSRAERVLDQLAAMLARETDYVHERENIERLRAIFAGRSDVVIPVVEDELTSAGVLSMSFESGVKINDQKALAGIGVEPEALAKLLVGCYFTMLFQHRVFHADPHPGNFLVRSGPQLIILDYGAVEEVTERLQQGMKRVVLGVVAKNDDEILRGLEHMGFVAEGGDRELLARVGREYLSVLGSVKIQDFSKLDREQIEKLSGYDQMRGKLRQVMKSVEYPEGYFYVERTLALLFGLVGQLAPKQGLPGLVLPYAMQAFATGVAKPPPAPSAEGAA